MKYKLTTMFVITLIMFQATSEAADGKFYLDAGVSFNHKNDDIYVAEKHYAVKWKAPFLFFKLGYSKNGWSGYIQHKSSYKQRDTGMNEAVIEKRLFEW